MALIKCPDCGKDVSNVAPSCPNCGRPVLETVPAKVESGEKKTSPLLVGCIILFLAAVFLLIIRPFFLALDASPEGKMAYTKELEHLSEVSGKPLYNKYANDPDVTGSAIV